MNMMQRMVADFHRTFRFDGATMPTMPSDMKVRHLRIRLIDEELNEFADANSKGDIIETADALADMLYVIYGACDVYGIDIEPVFEEVHRSNMSKLWTHPEKTAHLTKWGHTPPEELLTFELVNTPPPEGHILENNYRSYIARRPDGKVVKSPSYSPADIRSVLEKQNGTQKKELKTADAADAGNIDAR